MIQETTSLNTLDVNYINQNPYCKRLCEIFRNFIEDELSPSSNEDFEESLCALVWCVKDAREQHCEEIVYNLPIQVSDNT